MKRTAVEDGVAEWGVWLVCVFGWPKRRGPWLLVVLHGCFMFCFVLYTEGTRTKATEDDSGDAKARRDARERMKTRSPKMTATPLTATTLAAKKFTTTYVTTFHLLRLLCRLLFFLHFTPNFLSFFLSLYHFHPLWFCLLILQPFHSLCRTLF